MKINKFIAKSSAETKKIAAKFAKGVLAREQNKHAAVVGLVGELGSGKTTFVKGFAEGLGIKQIIQSPTFIIARSHKLRARSYKKFIHIDAYRIGSKDLVTLGWREWIRNPENIIVVEWAERISKIMPKNSIKIQFETLKNGQRKISFQ